MQWGNAKTTINKKSCGTESIHRSSIYEKMTASHMKFMQFAYSTNFNIICESVPGKDNLTNELGLEVSLLDLTMIIKKIKNRRIPRMVRNQFF